MSFVSRHVTDSHDFRNAETRIPISSGKWETKVVEVGDTKNPQPDQNEASSDDKETSVDGFFQLSQYNWSEYGDLNGDGIFNEDDLNSTVGNIASYFKGFPVTRDGNCFYHAMVNYIIATVDLDNESDKKTVFMRKYMKKFKNNEKSVKKVYGDDDEEKYTKMYMMHCLRKEILKYYKKERTDGEEYDKQKKHLLTGVNKTGLTKRNTDKGRVNLSEWAWDYEIGLMADYLGIDICTLQTINGELEWIVSYHNVQMRLEPQLNGLVCFLKNDGSHFTNLTFQKPPEVWDEEYRKTFKLMNEEYQDKQDFIETQIKLYDDMSDEFFNENENHRNDINWNFYRYIRDFVMGMDLGDRKKMVLFHILTDREGRGVTENDDDSNPDMQVDEQKEYYDTLLKKNEKIDRIDRFDNYIIWAQNFLKNNNENAYFDTYRFFAMDDIKELLSIQDTTTYVSELKKLFLKKIQRIELEGMGKMTKRQFRSFSPDDIDQTFKQTFKTHARIIKENGDTYQTDIIWKISEKETNKATDEVKTIDNYDNLSDEERLAEIVQIRSVDNVLNDLEDKTDQDIYLKQMAVFLLRHYQTLAKPKKISPGVFLSSYPNFKWRFENKAKPIACGWRWEALIKKGHRTDEHMESIRRTHSLINELNELGEKDELNLVLGSTLEQLEKLEEIIKMAKREYRRMQEAGKQMIKKNKNKPKLLWYDPWSENIASSLVPKTPSHDKEEEEEEEEEKEKKANQPTTPPTNHWNPKAGAEASEPPQIFTTVTTLLNYYGYAYYAKRDKNPDTNEMINTEVINTWESIFNNWKTTGRSQKANNGNKLFLASLRVPGKDANNNGVRSEFRIYNSPSSYFQHLIKWANLFGWEGVSPDGNKGSHQFTARIKKTSANFNKTYLNTDDDKTYTTILNNYNDQRDFLPQIINRDDFKVKIVQNYNVFTAIMSIDFVWRQWLQDSHVGKRYLINPDKTKKPNEIKKKEVVMDQGIFKEDEYTSRVEYDTWFQTAITVYKLTDPSKYTSNNTSNHFEEMKRIKNTDYQDLSEQQLLTLFVENIKNVRYFTMMQLLDTEQFNDFLKVTGGDKRYPDYNFGYNCFHFLGYHWPGMLGQVMWERSKNGNNESNDDESDDINLPPKIRRINFDNLPDSSGEERDSDSDSENDAVTVPNSLAASRATSPVQSRAATPAPKSTETAQFRPLTYFSEEDSDESDDSGVDDDKEDDITPDVTPAQSRATTPAPKSTDPAQYNIYERKNTLDLVDY